MILDPTDCTDYKEKIWDKSLRSAFEDKLCTIADAESYYLLNTFANMALARKEADMEFIHDSVMDLLQVTNSLFYDKIRKTVDKFFKTFLSA